MDSLMSRALDDLCPELAPRIYEVIARLSELGEPVFIVDVARTDAEQAVNLAKGVSATTHSKHIPATNAACPICHGTKSHAIDMAPYETFQAHGADKLGWQTHEKNAQSVDVLRLEWARIGVLGKHLGLRWGGDWAKPFDPGHLEQP